MQRGIVLYIIVWVLLTSSSLFAQRVSYCVPASDRYTVQVELAGRSGNYYWVQTTRNRRPLRPNDDSRTNSEQSFQIYDTRMTPVNTTPVVPFSDTELKEYFVAGDSYFDHLVLLAGPKTTRIYLQRYEPSGQPVEEGRILGSFPFLESGNSFLLVRSADKTRILLLGFQTVPSTSPKLYAILFDQDWQPLYQHIYKDAFITQPLIQDDFASYPLENFNNAPLKLANNGQWLMASRSRTSKNFLLSHFNGMDTGVSCKEIVLPTASSMEDVDLSIDNEKGEAFAAILSNFHYDALKSVQVAHYSMSKKVFDFDSSYRFSTLPPGKLKKDNLEKENFIAVPGKGFLLLKEYGRPFSDWYDGGDKTYDNQGDPDLLFVPTALPDSVTSAPFIRDGYARYRSLGSSQGRGHARGDLSLFYFPGFGLDSCWSGMIRKEQITEMNSPNLSYLVVPVKDKLFLLYNSFLRQEDQYATTTVLDHRGELQPQPGVVFWKFKNNLSFQQSRQISENEVVIPYDNLYGRNGFAIIQF